MSNIKIIAITLVVCFGLCCFIYDEVNYNYSCEDVINMNYLEDSGSFIIDNIKLDVRVHSHVMIDNETNFRLKFGEKDFLIQPEVGDSIFKVKGVFEYVLIKKDSTYVQSWSCETEEAFFVDKWKNGEKIYVPSSKPFPQPTDTSNSIFIK
jgi:hypothetical protein